MAARGWGLFSLYIYIEKLEKSSCQKPLDRFHYNLAKMFPWWPSTKIVQVIVICQKTWPLRVELIFPIYLYRKLEKIFLSETTGPISIYLGRNVFLVTLYQDCSSYHDLSKNMAGRGRGLFTPYIYIENFNDLLVRNHWTDFNLTLQKCFLCNPLWGYASRHDSSKNRAARGRGLFSLYIYI